MKKRILPIGITESRTEPWFRYSRGQQTTPKYCYYGGATTKSEARAKVIALAKRENKKWTLKIAAARIGRKSKSNTSGVVGVSLKTEKGRSPRSVYRYWWARWPENPAGVKFSILEHKNQKAFGLAQIARELKSTDKTTIEREYLARKKAGTRRVSTQAKVRRVT